MPSIQVRILDQIEDGMAIETEYEVGQRSMLSILSCEQPSIEEDNEVVPELPSKSRVRHVDDDDWEVSSNPKTYIARLKDAKIQRLKAQHWNRAKNINQMMATTTAEGRDSVEELRRNPRNGLLGAERPFDEQPESPMEREPPTTLFSPSTMSDSESFLEEYKQISTERYQKLINDPYAFSRYTDGDVIPQVVVVGANKSSTKSEDPAKTEEDEIAATENSASDDSWDILNKYDENAVNDGEKNEQNKDTTLTKNSTGRTDSPATDKPTPPTVPEEEALTESKDEPDLTESDNGLKGVSFIDDEQVDPKPSTEQPPSSKKTLSENKNNAVLGRVDNSTAEKCEEEPQPSNAVLGRVDSTAEKCNFGEEPQPSFGNISKTPCEELQAAKTSETNDNAVTSKEEEVSKTEVKLEHTDEEPVTEEAKDCNTSKDEVVSLSNNDFPEESVLELIMKRVEMSKMAKKQAESIDKQEAERIAKQSTESAADASDEASKKESESSPEPAVIEESEANIEKDSPAREEVTLSIYNKLPQDETQTEVVEKANSGFPSEASVDEKSFQPPQNNAESSKALLDSALQMIARLQKESAEKDDRLRSSDLYVQSLEKKLFEEKNAMEEERKRRAKMDSEQVSALNDKVSDTLNKLSCEEGKSNALQQVINDLKEELKEEKNKLERKQEEIIATKALFESEQNKVKRQQWDLAERDRTMEDVRSRVKELKEQLALANKRTSQEQSRATELQSTLLEKESQLEQTELKLEQTNMQLKNFLDGLNAREEIMRNEEIVEKKKQSIESRQQLIDKEEEKNKELLSKQLENASLAEDHQASAKKVEESLQKYYQLIQKEKEEVQRLKSLGKERKEQIAKEQSLIKELEATIVRKNAMVDLEKVKQRALESSIKQKGKLVDIEMSKMREHKDLCAKRMRQIEAEKEAIGLAIQEKEEMLCSEKAAIEYLQKAIETKKTLREERKALEKEISSGFGVETKRRSSIWTTDMEVDTRKTLREERKTLEKEILSDFGVEPKRRSSFRVNDMDVEEQKMILQELDKKKTLREERKSLEKETLSGFGAEPKRRSSIWKNDMDVEEQKMILQELGKLRSHYGSK